MINTQQFSKRPFNHTLNPCGLWGEAAPGELVACKVRVTLTFLMLCSGGKALISRYPFHRVCMATLRALEGQQCRGRTHQPAPLLCHTCFRNRSQELMKAAF